MEDNNTKIFPGLMKKLVLGSAIFLAGYSAAFFKETPPDPKYLFEFGIPTDKGNLEGLISESPPIGRRKHFYIKTGTGNSYMESDAFNKEFPGLLDSIGYSKRREDFILLHAVHNFSRYSGLYGEKPGPPNLYFRRK